MELCLKQQFDIFEKCAHSLPGDSDKKNDNTIIYSMYGEYEATAAASQVSLVSLAVSKGNKICLQAPLNF